LCWFWHKIVVSNNNKLMEEKWKNKWRQ
jgi:hypothetical protein